MTILANTRMHLVEFESGVLTISRRSDQWHLAMTGKRIAGDFRDCLKTRPAELVVATYIRLAQQVGITWQPSLYKPGMLPPYEEKGVA